LNALACAKYFLEKEKTEKKFIWALGKDKKLLQYRLPDTPGAWTGPDAMAQTPHFNIVAHHKPGFALGTHYTPFSSVSNMSCQLSHHVILMKCFHA
jgi:hypothetical protein